MLSEPLDPASARKLIRQILSEGTVRFHRHAYEAMEQRNLLEVDCVNVLRGGIVEPAELVEGTWRYRVRTPRGIFVVVAFRSETELVVDRYGTSPRDISITAPQLRQSLDTAKQLPVARFRNPLVRPRPWRCRSRPTMILS